jgi:hypothetical protein
MAEFTFLHHETGLKIGCLKGRIQAAAVTVCILIFDSSRKG